MKRHLHHDQKHPLGENSNGCVSYKSEIRQVRHREDSQDFSCKDSYRKNRRKSDEARSFNTTHPRRYPHISVFLAHEIK
jgi:hypothetical protein